MTVFTPQRKNSLRSDLAMRRVLGLFFATLLAPTLGSAQQSSRPGLLTGQPAAQPTATSSKPGPAPVVITYDAAPCAPPSAAPSMMPCAPSCQPCVPCCPEDPVLCVTEVKKHTKTVYSCRTKNICLPHCRCCLFWGLGKGDCATCDCGSCECGKVKCVNVLVKKTVPDCDTLVCVPKKASELAPKAEPPKTDPSKK